MFDRIVLLSEGHTIYNGPPEEVEQHFQKWGFVMPIYANPADKLINIASAPWVELRKKPFFSDLENASKSEIIKLNYSVIDSAESRQVSFYQQYQILVNRGWTVVKRMPIALGYLSTLVIVNSLMWGALFWQVDQKIFLPFNETHNRELTSNLLGLAFLTV